MPGFKVHLPYNGENSNHMKNLHIAVNAINITCLQAKITCCFVAPTVRS